MTEAPHCITARTGEPLARDERLARALRENLRRRKEQARAKQPLAGASDDPTGDDPPA